MDEGVTDAGDDSRYGRKDMKNESPRITSRIAVIAAISLIFSAAAGFAQAASGSAPDPAPAPGDKAPGLVIDAVSPGGPAEKAGLAAHDVITAIEGTSIHSVPQIVEALARHKPGDTMEVTVITASGGAEKKVTMTLGVSPVSSTQPYMGLTIALGSVLLVPEGQAPQTPKPALPGV